MRKLLVMLVVLGILAGLGYSAWTLIDRTNEDTAPPATETAQRVDIVDRVIVTGSVAPREEVELKPRVAGIITELRVEPGQRVDKGQVIAKIEVIAREETVADYESRVRAAKLSLADAKRELQQLEALSATGAVSANDVRRAQLQTQLAKEELRAAREGLRAIREGALRKTEDAANLVVATIAGTVLAVPVKVGASVVDSNSFNEGTTVATVADMEDLVFIGWVDESDVGRIREGMEATLAVGAIEDAEIRGVVERIAPKGELRQGVTQFEVRASVTKPSGPPLRAGYSANAHIVIERREDVLGLPEKLLVFEEQTPYVEVMVSSSPPRFERRRLTLGLSDGIYAEILDGVGPEDLIRVPAATLE